VLRTIICRLLFALPMALLLAAAARAEGVIFPDLADPVPGLEKITYLDLVRQVVPDIAAAAGAYRGYNVIDVRHIGGDEMKSAPPETASLVDAAALPVRSDGKDRLLLMLDLGEGVGTVERFTVLALYSLAGTPTLLDAATVGFDRNTYFRDPGRLSLGEGKDVALTMSTHFNSSQGYATTALILIRNDRLQLVDTISTFDDKYCSYERTQVPEFRAGDRDGHTYSDIVATVTETVKLTGQTCGDEETPGGATRTIAVTYRWDDAASRFVPDSDAFEVLARENSERF